MSIYTFRPTFLYIKQHLVTGKLYFGKTTKNPETYLGSGSYWTNHIRKYGKEHVVNLWYCLFYNEQDCKDFALSFSFQNTIAESSAWANQIPENGLDGNGTPGYVLAKNINSGIVYRVKKSIFDSTPDLVGVNFGSKKISQTSSAYAKGKVLCKDANGTYLRVEKEVFEARPDLVGVNKGSTGTKGSKGMIWVNNNITELLIEPHLLSNYSGWETGRLPMSTTQKDLLSRTRKERHIAAPNKGKTEFIKDGIVKYFFKGEQPAGWEPNIDKKTNNGKHWYNNGVDNFLLCNEEAVARNLTKGRLPWLKIQSTDSQ